MLYDARLETTQLFVARQAIGDEAKQIRLLRGVFLVAFFLVAFIWPHLLRGVFRRLLRAGKNSFQNRARHSSGAAGGRA